MRHVTATWQEQWWVLSESERGKVKEMEKGEKGGSESVRVSTCACSRGGRALARLALSNAEVWEESEVELGRLSTVGSDRG